MIYDFDFSRFGYFGPVCMIGFRFFMPNSGFNSNCTVNAVASNIKQDLKKFKYSEDVYKNSSKMLEGLQNWRKKYKDLISVLGPVYIKGLEVFPAAFQKALNETQL